MSKQYRIVEVRTECTDWHPMTPLQEALHAIRAYLSDRNLHGTIYSPDGFEDHYLEITRTQHLITVTITDAFHAALDTADRYHPHSRTDHKTIDLNHPRSLQDIYEYVINKKRK